MVYAYFKEPVLNFEMHSSLFTPQHIGNLNDYFKDVKERLIPDEGSEYGYHFRDEDFYLFMMAHEYKHFSGGGTGVRSLVDTYIFLRKFKDSLDWDYLNAELDKLGIADFERNNRELAMKLLSMKQLTIEDKKHLDYFVMSETYGTLENSVNNRIVRDGGGSKVKYLWYRIFPRIDTYRVYYPWAYNHKFLLPVAWGYRLIRALTTRRKKVSKEINVLRNK